MQRRGVSGQLSKGQRQKTKPKSRKVPAAPASIADRDELLDQRTRERDEALAQQAATAEVLRVISRSPGDLQPVFNAILENATRICEAKFGILFLTEGDAFRTVALYGAPPAFAEARQREPLVHAGPGISLRQAAITGQPVQVADIQAEPAYTKDPQRFAILKLAGARTVLSVPMLKDDGAVGVINIYSQEVRPFTDKQIELLKSFAAQAVIAIENTRLLNELRHRTDDLSEALEQQTATSEVLKVISSSPTNVQPVFDSIAESAVRLCNGQFSFVVRFDGKAMEFASCYGLSAEGLAAFQSILPMLASEDTAAGRAISRRAVVEIPDVRADLALGARSQRLAKTVTYRSIAALPLLQEGNPIGAIAVARAHAGSFPERQMALLQAFADQAVIAIENVRLFDEVQARTRELSESLEQQTATSEVLRVISSSPGDLGPVFEAMLTNAMRICEAKIGVLYLRDGDGFRAVAATRDAPAAYVEARMQPEWGKNFPADGPVRRAAATKQVAHIADISELQSYRDRHPAVVASVELGKFRTVLSVPMLKDDELIGVITMNRQEVRPFGDKQIELVKNFAAQAVIAIENTRLLSELRESLQQQTATADVLRVISRSAFDLKVVLRTLVESAAQLCEAQQAIVTQRGNDGLYRLAAGFGYPQEFEEYMNRNPLAPSRETTTGRVALEGKIVHIPDVLADPEYVFPKGQKLGGYRSNLGVPLLRDGVPIGAFVLMRPVVKPFTDKQIELVESFAAQAVIAIENARLLNELRESLQQQTATADVLKVISRSTFNLKAVLTTLVETAVRVCEADIGNIARPVDNDSYKIEVSYGQSTALYEELARQTLKVGKGSVIGRTALSRAPVHILDAQTDPDYELREARKIGDYHTMLGVPMVREGNIVGVFGLARKTVQAFTEKQIELVTTFADQAVIAIENVRLFESVEARTRELAKSLEELRTTQDRLVQTQKLASLGQLTAGIAHEIKNPLNFVNNFSVVSSELIDELQDTLKGMPFDDKARSEIKELTDTLRSNLDKVVQHGKRADAIVKNMLLHSRQGSGEHRSVDINALVEEGLNLAYHGARAETQGFNIKLERSLDPTAGEADIFPQDITRVLLNLISNGFYAATRRRAETNGGDYEPTLAAATKNLGDRVEISIRDNGTGIPPDVKEKIFNPFFTTKPAGEGTGLGLSISHDIVVKQHGGSIEVNTRQGAFTEIRIILPRAAALLPEQSQ